jgi:hypothetical protein
MEGEEWDGVKDVAVGGSINSPEVPLARQLIGTDSTCGFLRSAAMRTLLSRNIVWRNRRAMDGPLKTVSRNQSKGEGHRIDSKDYE